MPPIDFASLAAFYAAGGTPLAIIGQILARIAAGGERPVWITLVPPDRVRAEAETLPPRRAAGEDLPLYGIPFAVKDNIDVAGLPTTAGCPDFAATPPHSATVVTRLQAAGALLIGKTNLDQFATGLVGTRSPYGVPNSVFSKDLVSGGSSSGSAVAVAAGLVSFALGTDTAGSGRVPAAFNNIVGLKPTRGLISTTGVLPACRTLDCVSIFAGTVADAALALRIAQGYDAADPYSRPAAAPPTATLSAPFRFGVPTGIAPENPAARALHEAAIARLQSLGGIPVPFDFAPFAAAGALLYQGPWVAERLAALQSRGLPAWSAMDPSVAAIISAAGAITAADAFAGLYKLAETARATTPLWQSFDVMLLPTAPFHPRIDAVRADPIAVNARLGAYTNFVNLLDLSACAIPAGMTDDGLPYGITLIAPAFADASLAHLAARLHTALPGATIGATGHAVPPTLPPAAMSQTVDLAVVGAHLTGQPLNHQLTTRAARHIRTTRTATGYRLYALAGTTPAKPGLVRDAAGEGLIEVEIWRLTPAAFGAFVAEIPPPLAIGTLTLEDGTTVKGFVCEPAAIEGATDITAHGGWRAWLAQRA
jgi:allophanate hydrolase